MRPAQRITIITATTASKVTPIKGKARKAGRPSGQTLMVLRASSACNRIRRPMVVRPSFSPALTGFFQLLFLGRFYFPA
ncbi:MAG: hypothetical protein C4519_20475 [Desulfobacteraceae bacterium]|nr:MAG: hypothetical protein C4519_20475 [Desulfobacteraceae bacterium]